MYVGYQYRSRNSCEKYFVFVFELEVWREIIYIRDDYIYIKVYFLDIKFKKL